MWRRIRPGSLGLLLGLLLLLIPLGGPRGEAFAWGLPNRSQQPASAPAASARRGPAPAGSPVQEVAPPAAVLQLNEALAERQPRVRILEPSDGALLPDGPWTLRLQVEDWPLVDAGALGLGPHLLVQIDDAAPTPLVESSQTLPPLSPGSHRLTVMAARPWGEVVKRPGAFAQIRLNRVAANPLSQPSAGTPQLLATAPLQASQAEPVLLDWLLIDAPLQHLRADDARWRLRISVNGDSFLVDQATPLWLKGWRQGSNALLLELVNGQGEPLNPPFNSLVREVRLDRAAPRPAWLGGRLSETELAQLLGQQPAEEAGLPAKGGAPDAVIEERAKPSSSIAADAVAPIPAAPQAATAAALAEPDAAPLVSQPSANEPPATENPRIESPETETPATESPMPAPVESAALMPVPVDLEAPLPSLPMEESSDAPEESSLSEESPAEPAAETPADPQPPVEPRSKAPPPAAAADPASGEASSSAAEIAAPANAAEPMDVAAKPGVPAGGMRPAARDEVNPDGTLIRPRGGPLQALRERLKR